MPIITAQEISAIAFTEPIDLALINDEIINAAEGKYLISAITKLVYDDLLLHPVKYATLIANYINPYLAYCVKFLLYSQNQLEISPNQNRADIVNELNLIMQAKKDLLIKHLANSIYPLYISPVKKRVSGFIIK